jgi:hypothetical protein
MFLIPLGILRDAIRIICFPIRSATTVYHSKTMRIVAKNLMSQQATTCYLIHKAEFETWTSFPVHEEIKHKLIVKKMEDLMPKAMSQGDVLFVSHKWLGNKPDTDNNDIFPQS